MEYTSYVDSGRGPDQFDVLRTVMEIPRKAGREVYVLAVPRGEYDLEKLKAACRDIPEASHAIHVNGTIDVVVDGDLKRAEEIGRRISACTGEPIGCVHYDGAEDGMINFYRKLKAAIRTAREAIEPVHTYDPTKDSIAARAATLRDSLAGKG